MPQLVKLITDVALFDQSGQVLLVHYADTNRYDHQPGWFLPDDALVAREHLGDAAQRILRDQLRIDAARPILDHIESFVGRDRSRHMVFHYRATLDAATWINPAQDISEARWFHLDALPPRTAVARSGWALGDLERIGHCPELAGV